MNALRLELNDTSDYFKGVASNGLLEEVLKNNYGDDKPKELLPTSHKVYVIYTSDSVQSLHAADMMQKLANWYKHSASHGRHYDFEVVSVNNAIIRDTEAPIFVWLGLKPEQEICVNLSKKKFAKAKHVILTEQSCHIDDFGEFGVNLRKYFEDHNGEGNFGLIRDKQSRNSMGMVQYGMLLEAVGTMLFRFSMGECLEFLKSDASIIRLVEMQQVASRFEMHHVGKNEEALAQVHRSFEATILVMRNLGLAAGMIDITDIAAAYKRVVDNVRAQMNTTGQVNTRRHKDTVINAYFTQIVDFYWVARRLIRMCHGYYVNISLCQMGLMMTSNVPEQFGIDVSTGLFRSK